MGNVKAIENAVESLPPMKLAEFRRWFAEFDGIEWDRQIERGACRLSRRFGEKALKQTASKRFWQRLYALPAEITQRFTFCSGRRSPFHSLFPNGQP